MNNILKIFFSKSQIDKIQIAKSATTLADKADKDSIVFYRLSDVSSLKTFQKRTEKSQALLYVVEANFQPEIKGDHVVVDRQSFELLQEEISKIVYPLNTDIKFIGVTGTNGKSSVVNYCARLLNIVGDPALAIGTIGISDGEKVIDDDVVNTTPSYIDLMGIVFKYQNKFKNFIFEFSSHALDQKRLLNIKLDIAAWTSFSQDHLDYHKTMEAYFAAKLIIFNHLKDESSKVVVPHQQDFGYKILGIPQCRNQVVFTKSIDYEKSKLHFVYQQGFNLENIEVSLMVVSLLGHPEVYSIDLSEIRPPSGRFEIIPNGEKFIVVDYAHTPDAIEKLLQSAKVVFKGKRLHLIFGCGGDRDAKKRPVMGRVASENADIITLTSDNPRSEDPSQIIDDIAKGMVNLKRPLIEPDRKLAICNALSTQGAEEVIIIAGKGHESTQEIKGTKMHFNDKEIVESFLMKR